MFRKVIEDSKKTDRSVLRHAMMLVVMLMCVGVNTAWATDYYYFIVNKSGKIVTYAKRNDQTSSTAANGNAIPPAIKSVNGTNWKLYNGDQISSSLSIVDPLTTKPGSSYIIDCSSWGDVTLVGSPSQMSTLADCESSTNYPNYIFVFSDYDDTSIPDLKNGTYYTMKYRGNSANSYAYYDVTTQRVKNTGTSSVSNPEDDSKYLWCFKAAVVNGEIDPYDIKIYNASVGTGVSDHIVANPLDAGSDGVGSGPENENNKLQPASVLTPNRIASYYVATSYYSGQYNITANPAYNTGDKNQIFYNLWAEYNNDSDTRSGITSQGRFMRNNSARRMYPSIILTKASITYIIVDAAGNTIAQALTLSNTLEVPDVIKSPFASYTYYSTQADAIDETNPISSVTSTTIYVRYTTSSGDLDLNGGTDNFICTNGNYLFAASSNTIGIESSLSDPSSNTRKWKIIGNDAYQLTIQNADNSQYVTYNVSSGEAVPTLSGTGSKFFLHQSTAGTYEVVAITSGYYSTNYYSMGVANSTLKLYSSSNYAMGDDELQSDIYSQPTCATPDIAFDNSTGQVTITCATEGATIHYTTNGDTPTESSPSTPNPFTINTATTVKAIATHAGYLTSEVATQPITQVATPTIQDNGSNAISITCATEGATIYYTTDGSTPTTSSTEYTGPLTEGVSGVTIKAIAVKENMITSAVGSGTVTLQCAAPIIHRSSGGFTIACATAGATIYYTYVAYPGTPTDPTTSSSHISSGGIVSCTLPVAVKAFATASNYNNSDITTANVLDDLDGSGTQADPYIISSQDRVNVFIDMVNTEENASAYYKVTATSPLDFSSAAPITEAFSGTFDGGMQTITGLSHALFNTVSGGTVKNVILENVSVSGSGNVGAIADEMTGTSTNIACIYNCGILSGSVSGDDYVGGFVGLLGSESDDTQCYARVINCFSYANITGGTNKGGIVGYNSYTSTSSDIRTMVMNCMFYGDIPSGGSPIYGGLIIDNDADNNGLNNFNYFSFDDFTGSISPYNCALGAERRYLQRFEFHRNILNSNRELAAWYATGDPSDGTGVGSSCEMAKWVLDKSIAPYPILKPQGYYPSVINYEDAPSLGAITISISQGSGCPTGATVNNSKELTIYDKSIENHHYNYRTIRLPYYCEVGGTLNYTKNKVVTGWDVTVTGGSANFTDAADSKNFANRDANAYSRVFSQGAYLDLPEGENVAVSITAHWANCVYLSDPTYDVTYNTSYAATNVAVMPHYTNGDSYSINDDDQVVYTSFTNAIGALSAGSGTVYDHAIVLVGNYHQFCGGNSLVNNSKLFTVMSADLNSDCEPDYSFFYQHTQRRNISPVRFDFLNFPGIGIGQKVNGTQNMAAQGIFRPRGWFEITNTCLVHFVQFEHDWKSKAANSPVILLGGIYDQIVSGNGGSGNDGPYDHTSYIHLGSNAYFEEFSNGVHGDASWATSRVPISVTGGEYKRFYLSGMFNPEAALYDDDKDAECYIDGGYFPEEVAGAGQEKIDGNVTWNIINADITNFYGGGINDAKPITGNITVNIKKSRVDLYCGGPKFGNMSSGKDVTTAATDCTFGKFFGAGYGGTSYYRYRTHNDYTKTNYTWSTWAAEYERAYVAAQHGISTSYEYEYTDRSGASDNTRVGRFYINYASLSLAETQDVTSTLTGCTIQTDFFGGGNLGKVNGNVESQLTNCTVYGSVFGAGFSATIPTVDVWPTTGFVSVPSYNGNAGVYVSGNYPDTEAEGMVVYTWSDNGSTSSPFTEDSEGNWIYTDKDLATLGQVTGNATLTIDGDSTIGTDGDDETGHVYGGGDESSVQGNTIVNLEGNTEVLGNVFGGGNEGVVSGSATVNIEQ